uniref:S1 motif domain-containing protein n=1 Tax=Anopheles maculatus TaxID=74869 RepID=A0A182T0R8_9DIPT
MKTHSGTYSYRLKEYFKTHPMLAQSVVKGALLKGNCITVNGTVYVTPLLSNYSERFVVNGPVGHASVSDGSTIMMRVKNVHKTAANRFQLQVNTLLEHVCANGIDGVHEFVAAYMRDVDDLIQRYQEQHFAFANFTIGQHVECVVESIVPNSEKLAIEVHAIDKKSKYVTKGIATAILPNKPATSYKVGSKVPGRVVWIDVERMLVHVCLDQSLFECIALNGQNDSQTAIPKEPQECWVLFANKFVHVCCLKHGPAQLLIVPVKHHYNEIRTTEKQNADKTLK